MSTKVSAVSMKPVDKMIKDLGLDKKGIVQQEVTHQARMFMDPYVPKRSTVLKRTAVEHADSVEYIQPYARYQYYGKLMLTDKGGSWAKFGEKKPVLTDTDLEYNEAPQRGAYWDKKMLADKGDQFYKSIKDFVRKQKRS